MTTENELLTDDQVIDSEIIPLSDEEFHSLMSGKGTTKTKEQISSVGETTKPALKQPDDKTKPAGKSQSGTTTKTVEEGEEEEEEEEDETGIDAVDDTDQLFQKDDKKPGQKGKQQPGSEDNIDIAALRATADYLIEKGYWKEIEDWENLELTVDVYAAIAEQQAVEQAEDILTELMDRTGKYRKILEHAMSGNGSPDTILELFKQENRLNMTDPKNVTDAETLIRNYYSTVVGWEDTDVEAFISKARDEKTLEKHADFAKKKSQEFIDKNIKKEDDKRILAEKQAKARREEYEQGVRNAIKESKLPAEFASVMEQFAFKPAIKVPDTNKVLTGYQARMLQIQSNPKEYTELLHYLLDKKGYLKSQNTAVQTKDNERTFGNILAGNRVGKAKTGSGIIQRSTDNDDNGTMPKWSSFMKKIVTKKSN